MYKAFYGFTGVPFSKDIKHEHIFQSEYFKELLSRLDYIKKHRGMMLVTGEAGVGKTTALRYWLFGLRAESFFKVYIPLSTVGVTDFYRQLNDKLNGEYASAKSRLFKSIQERILELSTNQNRIPVVVIDESHLLKNENFFELQIILNFKMDSFDPAIFILVSQTHLNDRLQRSILKSFNQRISMKYHIKQPGFSEIKDYIAFNLKLNGVNPDIFTDPAYKAVFNISQGILRTTGKLVIKTLTFGAMNNKQSLSEEDVLTASKEL
jgi:type II secretory pathway predicted ATPase ExeA